MSTLGRRLTALEEIAEELRLRLRLRELAEERGISLETLMHHYEQCRARTAALRAQGLTDAQIEEEIARGMGLGVDELRAERDELLARFT